jgi:hypothetical protein
MSKLTVLVDQFILNSLQPEMDRLTIALLNMEKYGYNSPSIQETRRKLNSLVPVYDFLREYADGNEEATDADIRDLISISGMSLITSDTNQPKFDTPKGYSGLTGIDEVGNDYFRMYIDGEIASTIGVVSKKDPVDIDIFVSNKYKYLKVGLSTSVETREEIKYTNHLRFSGVRLDSSVRFLRLLVEASLDDGDVIDYEKTINTKVLTNKCTEAMEIMVRVGATPERFTIADDIGESAIMTIGPNDGSAPGITFDWDWVINNTQEIPIELVPPEEEDVAVYSADGDTHLLVIYPKELTVSKVTEEVLIGVVQLKMNLHYSIGRVPGNMDYNYVYMRDLSATTYKKIRPIKVTLKAE